MHCPLSIMASYPSPYHNWLHHLLSPPLRLLSTYQLVCGPWSSAIRLPSRQPGGYCTLVVDEKHSPQCVKCFECQEKRYINGIEKLKREDPTWEKTQCWEGMKSAFGGPLSVTWFSPFTDLSCQKDDSSPVPMFPQGEIIEEDVIEIPLEPH